MKIYRLNENEYWMAPTLEEAINAAIEANTSASEAVSCTRADVVDEEFLHELTEAEMDSTTFVDAIPDEDEPETGWPERSFRAQLALEMSMDPTTRIFAVYNLD